MSDKDFTLLLKARKTDCPICGDPLSDHTVSELGNCHYRKQIKRIFKQANGKEPEIA